MSKTFAILTVILCMASAFGGYFCRLHMEDWRFKYYHGMSNEELQTKVTNDSDCYAMALLGYRMMADESNADMGDAFQMLVKSATQGNAWGQSNLGQLYFRGIGVNENPKVASVLFARSALQGSRYGQEQLGQYYIQVEKDTAEASRWFMESAAQGYDGIHGGNLE